jgi:hypothetical protein
MKMPDHIFRYIVLGIAVIGLIISIVFEVFK